MVVGKLLGKLGGDKAELKSLEADQYDQYCKIGNMAMGFLLAAILYFVLAVAGVFTYTACFVLLLFVNMFFFHRLTLATLYPDAIRAGREAQRQRLHEKLRGVRR